MYIFHIKSSKSSVYSHSAESANSDARFFIRNNLFLNFTKFTAEKIGSHNQVAPNISKCLTLCKFLNLNWL